LIVYVTLSPLPGLRAFVVLFANTSGEVRLSAAVSASDPPV
jgi:hypothetical protein